jgi:REP element-mobilizing transposase RayT
MGNGCASTVELVPRRPRDFREGIYHLSPRASDTRRLFADAGERRGFLDAVAAAMEASELRLVAYILMGTHYHLVLYTPGGRISTALQRLHTEHSRRHNKAEGHEAHLFRAHPSAREVTTAADLLNVCRYLAYNPVLAGLAQDPFTWRWSSAAATAGLVPSPIPLDEAPLRAAFGDTPGWRDRYRRYLEATQLTRAPGSSERRTSPSEPAATP